MKSYVRSIPSSEKDDMNWKLSALRVVAFVQCVQKSEKTMVTSWISSSKTSFSQRNQVAETLSKLTKDASNVPSFIFILHVHRQANC